MILSRQALNDYLDRRLQSYTWMKALKRRELEEELRYFRVPPVFKTRPWTHQLVCFFIAQQEPRFLFLLDMGLGKSKILLDRVVQAKRERKVRRALITVPNVVNMESWKEDTLKHTDLEPWACDVASVEEKWDRLADPDGDVVTVDYQGLMLALCPKTKGKKGKMVPSEERIARLQRLYGFIGIDESHKLKNHQNLWFSVMDKLCEPAAYVYATTGTVFGKNPEAMWSQFKLVDRGETFGENLGLFRTAFFYQSNDTFGPQWTFNKRTSPDLHRMMQHRSIRYDEDEVPEVDLPKRMPPIVKPLRMGSEQREHFLRALEGLINAQGSGDPNAMDAPWTRMRQIVSGYLTWKDEHGEHTVRFEENPKLLALEQDLMALGSNKIVICHYYTETGQMLVDKLKELGIGHTWLYGGTKDKVGARRKFMEDPGCRAFVMNTEAGGTGNDGLQKVAKYMAFYESPTTPDTRKQVEKRIHRPGQRERTFFIDYVMKGSMDRTILESIAEGLDVYDSVVNGRIKARDLLRS